MIYDLFYFFNELDLLEIRLNVLDSAVDKFVLVEFSETYSGIPRQSEYLKNKERYAKWEHKIIHYIVDDFPLDDELLSVAMKSPNIGRGEDYWIREFYLKESARKAITDLNDNDIVFISDLDEIWNPQTFTREYLANVDLSNGKIIRPKQAGYYYYLNNRCSEQNGWTGTTLTEYKTIKEGCINHLRTRSLTTYEEVENGGWHFGFMGGIQGALKKLVDSNHPEYNGWISTIEERVKNNQDYRGRGFTYWTDEESLPQYLKDNKQTWIRLFRS
jgi:beta-1,4-mannosyl-glycoprotein beta-1,4-N-acetylglucosaminyltransferase